MSTIGPWDGRPLPSGPLPRCCLGLVGCGGNPSPTTERRRARPTPSTPRERRRHLRAQHGPRRCKPAGSRRGDRTAPLLDVSASSGHSDDLRDNAPSLPLGGTGSDGSDRVPQPRLRRGLQARVRACSLHRQARSSPSATPQSDRHHLQPWEGQRRRRQPILLNPAFVVVGIGPLPGRASGWYWTLDLGSKTDPSCAMPTSSTTSHPRQESVERGAGNRGRRSRRLAQVHPALRDQAAIQTGPGTHPDGRGSSDLDQGSSRRDQGSSGRDRGPSRRDARPIQTGPAPIQTGPAPIQTGLQRPSDRTYTRQDSTRAHPDGTRAHPDGTRAHPDGTYTHPYGTHASSRQDPRPSRQGSRPSGQRLRAHPDRTRAHPNGTRAHPDRTTPIRQDLRPSRPDARPIRRDPHPSRLGPAHRVGCAHPDGTLAPSRRGQGSSFRGQGSLFRGRRARPFERSSSFRGRVRPSEVGVAAAYCPVGPPRLRFDRPRLRSTRLLRGRHGERAATPLGRALFHVRVSNPRAAARALRDGSAPAVVGARHILRLHNVNAPFTSCSCSAGAAHQRSARMPPMRHHPLLASVLLATAAVVRRARKTPTLRRRPRPRPRRSTSSRRSSRSRSAGPRQPKLVASNQIDPAVGTYLRLGDCYEHLGRSASAWTAYTEAVSLAHKRNDNRVKYAEKNLERVEPTLSRVVLGVAPRRRASNIPIKGDGVAAPPRPPGPPPSPSIQASRRSKRPPRGKQTWTTTLQIEAKPGLTTVQVPILELAHPAGGSPAMRWELNLLGPAARCAAPAVGAAGVAGLAIGCRPRRPHPPEDQRLQEPG